MTVHILLYFVPATKAMVAALWLTPMLELLALGKLASRPKLLPSLMTSSVGIHRTRTVRDLPQWQEPADRHLIAHQKPRLADVPNAVSWSELCFEPEAQCSTCAEQFQ